MIYGAIALHFGAGIFPPDYVQRMYLDASDEYRQGVNQAGQDAYIYGSIYVGGAVGAGYGVTYTAAQIAALRQAYAAQAAAMAAVQQILQKQERIARLLQRAQEYTDRAREAAQAGRLREAQALLKMSQELAETALEELSK